jgi:hypothetical protein
LDFHEQLARRTRVTSFRLPAAIPLRAPLALALAGALAVAGWYATAQLAPGDRGVPPIDSSSNLEVTGVKVDIAGRTADEARTAGWREAQRRGWKILWARAHGLSPDAAPALPDGTLDSIVSSIEVEREQIGTHRYIATLGLLFDRGLAGAYLGGENGGPRSSPMLVIPVQFQAGTEQTFEERTPWQRAWARFRAGASAVDYVRPVGSGADPILLHWGQARRPGRIWWRMLLDQYGASDVVVPEVHLRRLFPGGPISGLFVARHGPDGGVLGSFTLNAPNPAGLDAMLDEGVKGVDALYVRSLSTGALAPDPTLTIEEPAVPFDDMIANNAEDPLATIIDQQVATPVTFQIQAADGAELDQALAAIRSVPGASPPAVVSLVIGGQSSVSSSFTGDIGQLSAALAARGWRAEGSGTELRLRKGAPIAPPSPAMPPSPPPPAGARP